MKCPKCQKEMEKGFVIIDYLPGWDTKKSKFRLRVGGGKGFIVPGNKSRFSGFFRLSYPELPGYRCYECMVVFFDYSKG